MDTVALECVWNGTDGWVQRPELGRGMLLPPHDSRTTLGVASEWREPDASQTARRPRQPRRKYDEVRRVVVRALRAAGLNIADIASRLEMPIGTVYHILQEGRTGP